MDQIFWDGMSDFFDELKTLNLLPTLRFHKTGNMAVSLNLNSVPINDIDMIFDGVELMHGPVHSNLYPVTLTKLNIINSFRIDPGFDLSGLPSLRTLYIGNFADETLDGSRLPPSLTSLEIGYEVVQPLVNLPPSLTDLAVGSSSYPFNINHQPLRMYNTPSMPIENTYQHTHLQKLELETINIISIQFITSTAFPVLENLLIGSMEIGSYDLSTLPTSLKRLNISPDEDARITSFPSGLEHLEMSLIYAISIKLSIGLWTQSPRIKTLILNRYKYPLEAGDLPPALTSLTFPKYDPPRALDPTVMPASLRHLKWQGGCSLQLIQPVLIHLTNVIHLELQVQTGIYNLRRITPTIFFRLVTLINSGFIHIDQLQSLLALPLSAPTK
ncbi:hypothetical protein SAMD00019534_026390 [Acytostelium subglobosum LB1]|uniref:hypothetical protein n=1 Tax=Acytostelium subglobosum LB1 TaxID=1410327 RepID=UPI000644FCF0|nr:hypothetical protein SAMD00019534_026390 [Acytostelium subglobosum LB1]GAM19464.1 hypothetical protein SAMD00019534_026390 [Acytostelium subglobosum LB1]|eukprot:XP_012757391.1 hypothetical protein SAMD00019534_026390 [Acytostelium subglobosum LB1]